MSILIAMTMATLLLAWMAPNLGEQWFRPLERAFGRFARRKSLVIVVLGCATVLTRLALLPIRPIPLPAIHDEFSYLLAAHTFAHGRLTNPTHPMWVFFDTFHVLQHPTYMSKYPPGPAAAMALGERLGHPWIGVLLSAACMVMGLTWMLQGWVPPPWALLGGVLAFLQFGIFPHWVDSYYNGSLATVGAALVLGAYPHLLHSARIPDALRMGLGATILATTRPLEGLIFCVPLAIALPLRLKRKFAIKPALLRVLLPLTAVLTACLVFLGYYNARVTGNPLKFPHTVYHHQYFNDHPVFVWQKAPPPLHYDNPQFEFFFNTWNRRAYALTLRGWIRRSAELVWALWRILLGPIWTVPFLLFGRLMKDRRMRLPLAQGALCVIALFAVVWFQPHYTAPLVATVVLLLTQAMRHLRHASWQNRPFGLAMTRFLIILALNGFLIQTALAIRFPSKQWNLQRANIVHRLESVPGNHLVIVRYTPQHYIHSEWVYNAADIDHSRIVWAREIPGRDLQPLLSYFADRKVWLLQPDTVPPTLQPYYGAPPAEAP